MQRIIRWTRSSFPNHVESWRKFSGGLPIAVPIRIDIPSIPCLSQYIRAIASPQTFDRP
jgi:hypothetical protein